MDVVGAHFAMETIKHVDALKASVHSDAILICCFLAGLIVLSLASWWSRKHAKVG
jgi:hypothetical protein